MPETIIGLFDQDQQAQAIIPLLKRQGFQQNDIDLIGSGGGADRSELIDKLSRLGLADEEQRQCYVDGVSRGGTVLVARAEDKGKADQAAELMRAHGAINCGLASGALEGQGAARVPVVEEELRVGKREVQTGGVRVRQEVSERPVEAQVNLREERVNVERRAVDRPLTAADRDAALQEKTIEVTERSEQPVVQKDARVVEEVLLNKEVEEHTETVRDKVRRTDVKVEKIEGDKKRRPN